MLRHNDCPSKHSKVSGSRGGRLYIWILNLDGFRLHTYRKSYSGGRKFVVLLRLFEVVRPCLRLYVCPVLLGVLHDCVWYTLIGGLAATCCSFATSRYHKNLDMILVLCDVCAYETLGFSNRYPSPSHQTPADKPRGHRKRFATVLCMDLHSS